MPVSTPKEYHELYKDEDHFKHVLSELFVPAIEAADYDPIEPIAKGADLIHGEIIKNLEKADLVFCDASTLNPNVFFEFGIRTSLNLPICIVKDQFVTKLPFDTGIINHHEYNCKLDSWVVKDEIPKLTKHIKESIKRSSGKNKLWEYFGIKQIAHLPENSNDVSLKMDWIISKLDGLEINLNNQRVMDNIIDNVRGKKPVSKLKWLTVSSVIQEIMFLLSKNSIKSQLSVVGSTINIDAPINKITIDLAREIEIMVLNIGYGIKWNDITPNVNN